MADVVSSMVVGSRKPNTLIEADGVFFLCLAPDDRHSLTQAIDRLIALLDAGEPDSDCEPSLGWPEQGATSPEKGVHHDDREDENEHGGNITDEPHDLTDSGDDEPTLGRLETLHQGIGSYAGEEYPAGSELDFRGDGYRIGKELMRRAGYHR